MSRLLFFDVYHSTASAHPASEGTGTASASANASGNQASHRAIGAMTDVREPRQHYAFHRFADRFGAGRFFRACLCVFSLLCSRQCVLVPCAAFPLSHPHTYMCAQMFRFDARFGGFDSRAQFAVKRWLFVKFCTVIVVNAMRVVCVYLSVCNINE